MLMTGAVRCIIISVVLQVSASHACPPGTQRTSLDSPFGPTVNTSHLPENTSATRDCVLLRYLDRLNSNLSHQILGIMCSELSNVSAWNVSVGTTNSSSVAFLLCSGVAHSNVHQHELVQHRGTELTSCLANLTEGLLSLIESGRIVVSYRDRKVFLVCCDSDSHRAKDGYAPQGLQNLASLLQYPNDLPNDTHNIVLLEHCSVNLKEHVDSDEERCLSFPIWRAALPYINVCRVISLICLFLKMVLFVTFKKSRNFSSKCVMFLSVTMFFTLIFIGVASNLYNAHRVLFIAAHYGCLSSASWTTVLSYDIWSTIVSMSSRRGGNFYGYCSFGWGLPSLIMMVCSYFGWGTTSCGVSPIYGMVLLTTRDGRLASWVFFAVPMFVMLLVNLGFYVHIVIVIRRTAKDVEKNVTRGTDNYSQAWLFAKLAMIMGVGWLLACLARLIPVMALCCLIFDMSKSLQGMYLFVGFQDYKYLAELRHSRTFSWNSACKRGSSTARITSHEVPLYCVEAPASPIGIQGSFMVTR